MEKVMDSAAGDVTRVIWHQNGMFGLAWQPGLHRKGNGTSKFSDCAS